MLDRLRTHDRDEDGFTLIEVVVALTLFGVLLATVSVALGSMLNKVRNNQNRTVAANIATRTIDRLHAIPASQLPNGALPDQVFTADGSTFTVKAAAALVSDATGTTASACDGGGALSAKRVTVTVEWSGMGTAKPVRSDTLRQLTVSELNLARGSVSVRVVDRAGQPVAGQTLALTPGTAAAVTQADGCAVFSNIPSGAASISVVERSGWIDQAGASSPSRSVTVVGGALTKDNGFVLDRAGSLAATFALTPADLLKFPVQFGGMTLAQAALVGGSRTVSTTAAGATVTGLFPFADGYRVWAGRCTDARPTTLPAAVLVNPGAPTTTTLPVARVRVSVFDDDDLDDEKKGQPVRIRHVDDTACVGGFDTTISALASTHQVTFSLPAGTWSFNSRNGNRVTLTLQPGGAVRDIALWQKL